MSDIDIVGTLERILGGLDRIAAIVRARKNDGWSLFRSDETWVYHTAEDAPELTCPICLEFARDFSFDGEEVRSEFPAREVIEPIVTRPNVHEDPQYHWLKGRCRCTIIFDDHVQTLRARLADEMREVL